MQEDRAERRLKNRQIAICRKVLRGPGTAWEALYLISSSFCNFVRVLFVIARPSSRLRLQSPFFAELRALTAIPAWKHIRRLARPSNTSRSQGDRVDHYDRVTISDGLPCPRSISEDQQTLFLPGCKCVRDTLRERIRADLAVHAGSTDLTHRHTSVRRRYTLNAVLKVPSPFISPSSWPSWLSPTTLPRRLLF